jgi:hypothetical protein
MARIFAEILIKPIFKGILKLLTDGGMEKLAFRLRNEFVEYDPNEWRDGYDMTINVGLGSGDKVAQIQRLTMILQGMKELMPLGIASPQNIFHAASKLVEASGFKDVQNFLTDPANVPPQTPQPPLELQLKQMDIMASERDSERKHQEKMAELQANLELQASNDMRDSERVQQKAELDAQIESMRLQYEDKWKENENQTKLLIAGISPDGIQVAPPQIDFAPIQQMIAEMNQRMQAPPVVVNMGGPRRKSGKAVKLPDGSWAMEAVESDISEGQEGLQ